MNLKVRFWNTRTYRYFENHTRFKHARNHQLVKEWYTYIVPSESNASASTQRGAKHQVYGWDGLDWWMDGMHGWMGYQKCFLFFHCKIDIKRYPRICLNIYQVVHTNLFWVLNFWQFGGRMQKFQVRFEGGCLFIILKVQIKISVILQRPFCEKLSILIEIWFLCVHSF